MISAEEREGRGTKRQPWDRHLRQRARNEGGEGSDPAGDGWKADPEEEEWDDEDEFEEDGEFDDEELDGDDEFDDNEDLDYDDGLDDD